MRKLPSGRSGLCEQFRDSKLQQLFGEQKAGFQRHAADRRIRCRIDDIVVQRFVEKPLGSLLKDVGDNLQQPLRRDAFAVLDHRQVGHRGPGLGVDLNAAHREVLEGEVITLA